MQHQVQHVDVMKLLTLALRLFEAHFLPVQLFVVITASELYTLIYPSFLMPPLLKAVLDFCSACRLLSFGGMVCFCYLYEQYHRLCVGLRQEEMKSAGLFEKMVEDDAISPNVFTSGGILEAMLFPVGGILFGVLPGLQAILSHIFTERINYVVSRKPATLHAIQEDLESCSSSDDG